MRKLILIIAASSFVIFSCKKSAKTENTANTDEEINYTSKDIKLMLDSTIQIANSNWDSLTKADDDKMGDIKRLLDEISYCDGADEAKLGELFKTFEQVKALRYNQDNITGELIDQYDNAQNKLISEANSLAESTPNIEAHPLAIELMDDIVEADGMTFSKRGDYDICAKKINGVIKDYPELVQELGTPYSNYKRLGIFGFED